MAISIHKRIERNAKQWGVSYSEAASRMGRRAHRRAPKAPRLQVMTEEERFERMRRQRTDLYD